MTKQKNPTLTKTPCSAPRAAEILGTTRAGVYMAAKRRQIPFRKFGRRIVFFEEELLGFLDEQPGVRVEDLEA